MFICGRNTMAVERPIIICTRGSALALAQANLIAAQCRAAFPRLRFELKIIKTTGDKLQKASMAKTDPSLPKGLFTKELEVALVKGHADLAVHSLKDLPTDLPAGLVLAATPKREDVRDVLIYRSVEYIKDSATRQSADWSPGQSPQGLEPDRRARCGKGVEAPGQAGFLRPGTVPLRSPGRGSAPLPGPVAQRDQAHRFRRIQIGSATCR